MEKVHKAGFWEIFRRERLSYCTNCGFHGKPVINTPGNILIEIILWLFLIVPGLIYSIWRLTKRHDACPVCGNKVIPDHTPVARLAIAKQEAEEKRLAEEKLKKQRAPSRRPQPEDDQPTVLVIN